MPIDIYQHDSATIFRFILRGDLAGQHVLELEHAWTTARSILEDKELVVDVSGISDADGEGVELLHRMRDAGARLTAALPPQSEEFLRSLGIPVAASCGRSLSTRVLRLLRSAGVRYLLLMALPSRRPRRKSGSGHDGAFAFSEIHIQPFKNEYPDKNRRRERSFADGTTVAAGWDRNGAGSGASRAALR